MSCRVFDDKSLFAAANNCAQNVPPNAVPHTSFAYDCVDHNYLNISNCKCADRPITDIQLQTNRHGQLGKQLEKYNDGHAKHHP